MPSEALATPVAVFGVQGATVLLRCSGVVILRRLRFPLRTRSARRAQRGVRTGARNVPSDASLKLPARVAATRPCASTSTL